MLKTCYNLRLMLPTNNLLTVKPELPKESSQSLNVPKVRNRKKDQMRLFDGYTSGTVP